MVSRRRVMAGVVAVLAAVSPAVVAAVSDPAAQAVRVQASVARAPAAHADTTTVVRVRPTDRLGHVKPRYVVDEVAGVSRCFPSRSVIAGVYQCFSEGGHFDTCWLENAGSFVALCVERPWQHRAVRLTVFILVEASEVQYDNVWGLRLSGGDRCLALQGARPTFEGHSVGFACGRGLLTLRALDRTGQQWLVRSVVPTSDGYAWGPIRRVARAYVGLRSWDFDQRAPR